jgi:hypothetical protein
MLPCEDQPFPTDGQFCFGAPDRCKVILPQEALYQQMLV